MTDKQTKSGPDDRPIFLLAGCTLLGMAIFSFFLSPTVSKGKQFRHQQVVGTTWWRATSSSGNTLAKSSAESRPRLVAAYGTLPLIFEANQGQTDPQVKYLARGYGYTLFLTSREAVLSLAGSSESLRKPAIKPRIGASANSMKLLLQRSLTNRASAAVVRMQMVGANPNAQLVARQIEPGVSNYFFGKNPRNWRTNVPRYGRVEYQDVYSGIGLAFHGEQRHLEFDFIVASGANPAPINLHFTGADRLTTDDSGDLVVSSSAGDLTFHKPVAYQEMNGVRHLVAARFAVKDRNQVGFVIGDYDRSHELVIDPTLLYSTYLGGAGEDAGFGIAVDSSGNAYVAGTTNSIGFPGASGSPAGGVDTFVTKLNADGSAILYSTFLGGSADDVGAPIITGPSIVVDSSFNVYIAGTTTSSDFPVTTGAAQSKFGGAQDGFVAKLNSTGSALTYATYIGGSGSDSANAIAIDGSANAYVGGGEQSTDFPTTPGAFQTATADGLDGFVVKLNPTGTTFLYSSYLGGSNFDTVHGIALVPGCVSSCNVFVVGDAWSSDFPLKNAFDSTFSNTETFVTELNSSGSALVYSTFLGGDDIEQAFGIAVDSSGSAYVTGYTLSDDFPTVNAFQPDLHGFADGFVAKFSPDGSKLSYSSYLGSGDEGGLSIAVDSHGNAYVVGTSRTNLFPLIDPIQSSLKGDSDAFVTMIDPTGATMVYSTYLGGDGDENYKVPTADTFGSIAVDPSGAVYFTGRTTSSNGFPTASPSQGSFGGGAADAYVVKLTPAPTTPEPSVGLLPNAWLVSSGGTASPITVTVTPLNGFTGTVDLACSGLPAHAACNLNPSSVISSGTSILTISTREASAELLPPMNRRAAPLYATFLPVSAVALLGAGFAEIASRKRRLMAFVPCLLVFIVLIFLAACGGSSYGGGGGGGGGVGGGGATTPPGTYQITVTATSGASSHHAILDLEVN